MNKKYLSLIIIAIIILSFNTFTYALAIDNNCPLSIVHILQVTPALLCLEDRIDTLENAPPSAGSESTVCTNLGSVGELIVIDLGNGNCDFKKLLAGTGITMQSNGTRIMINSTSGGGETTQCINSGTGNRVLVINSTNGNCYIKTIHILAGSGIVITENADRLFFSSYCDTGGSGISVCDEAGVSNNLNSLIGGTSISITDTAQDLTIDNTAPDNTVCINVGSGTQVYKDGECNFKTIVGSPDISVTNTTNTIVIDYNGTGVLVGQLVAQMQVSQAKTNIGTGYTTVYSTGDPQLFEHLTIFDTTNAVDFRILFVWDYVGAGTQQCRFFDGTNVLYESTTFTADQFPYDSGWVDIPASFENQVSATVDWQCKSTTGTDDPIGKGYSIFIK